MLHTFILPHFNVCESLASFKSLVLLYISLEIKCFYKNDNYPVLHMWFSVPG